MTKLMNVMVVHEDEEKFVHVGVSGCGLAVSRRVLDEDVAEAVDGLLLIDLTVDQTIAEWREAVRKRDVDLVEESKDDS